MANLAGFDSSSFANMINHYTRHGDDPDQHKYSYRNQSIDKTKTNLNYQVGIVRDSPDRFIEDAIASVDVKPRGGKKATNVLSDWVVTLPKNELLYGREAEFFEQVYLYLKSQLGEERIVGAYVHLDESQPHMHFAFIPIVQSPVMTNDKSRPLRYKDGSLKRDRKGTIRYERVQVCDENGRPKFRRSFAQSSIYTKGVLKEFHPKLESFLTDHFGFHVGIELEDPGEKQLSKLNQKEYAAAKETLNRIDGQIETSAQRLESVQERIKERSITTEKRQASIGQVEEELRVARERERALEKENRTLRTALERAQKLFANLVDKIVASAKDIIGFRQFIIENKGINRDDRYNEHRHDR